MSEIEFEERTRETSLRDLYYVLFRHKWKMILFFFAVTITMTVGTFLSAKVYRSEAKLLVRLGRESVTLDPTAATGQIIQVSRSRKNEINSELEILKSQELLEKVVDAIGLEAFLAGIKVRQNLSEKLNLREALKNRDKVVRKVKKNLEIETLKDTSIISVSYEARNPKVTQQVVAKLIDSYLEKHIAVHKTQGSHQFFVQQSDHLQDKLVQSENELRNLKNETGISSVNEQRQVILDRISALEQEIDGTDAALAASTAKVLALEKTLNDAPETLEALLTEQATLSSLQAKVEVQKRQLGDAKAELTTLNDAEVRIVRLMREAGIQEANYRKYSENLEQARIDHAMESERISNISVVQAATLPIKPARPRKVLNLALGLFLGIFGAIGLAFFSEYLDHSIKTPEEVEERLQLPALAFIPFIPRVRVNGVSPTVKRRVQAKADGKTAVKVPAQWNIPAKIRKYYEAFRERPLLRSNGSAEAPLVPAFTGKIREYYKAFRERLRSPSNGFKLPVLATTREIQGPYEAFRERLLLCSNGSTGTPYALAVMSCCRHEGVSTVAANLAATLSRHDNEHVLLVDANIGHPSVHRIFKANLSPGLTDILANGQSDGDVIQSLPARNLDILPAGTTNGNLSEIFDSDGFTTLLKSMKNRYRFVVIDIPALNEASSAARVASLCDGVILVVEAERTRWEVTQRVKEELVKSNANVLGVVLNKRRFHVPEWLYQTL